MIKELVLVCSECNKKFAAKDKIVYKENFMLRDFANIQLLCPKCVTNWQEHWQIVDAEFFDEHGALYVKIKLANGETTEKFDCTAMDDIVAISADIPLSSQKELYLIYKKWYDEKMKDVIKSCSFSESFMRTSFTCETHGGEKYTDIAFRFNRLGELESEKPIPDNIKNQLVFAWNRYELSNIPIPDLQDK